MMQEPELDKFIGGQIAGVFSIQDMEVLRQEVEKLTSHQVHVQIGVDEGRSLYVAHHYALPDVYIYGIDISDPYPRGPFMQRLEMIGLQKNRFFIHGDADTFGESLLNGVGVKPFVNLLFVDGFHDYKSVSDNMRVWNRLMVEGGTILYHDYDHPDTKLYLDEQYGDNKEVLHDKIVRVKFHAEEVKK